MTQNTTINQKIVELFSQTANSWWDESGPFNPLHQINPLRLEYIIDTTINHCKINLKTNKSLNLLNFLDIGCGGGLLCEPLARLGSKVTGIDASLESIQVAQSHALQSHLDINYIHTSIEEFIKNGQQFDVVCCMEILEHVDNLDEFLKCVALLVKPGGLLFFSTLNRNLKSYVLGILMAERVLKWVPQGTHEWKRFLKPSEIILPLEKLGIKTESLKGVIFDPLSQSFNTSSDLSVNYMGYGIKKII